MSEFIPRPGQTDVLDYAGGKMGISAVPGSGKTRTLAELSARLVAEQIDDDQQVLIVTLVNSAVDNFRSRINESIQQLGLLPNFGYRVRTLHGLSHDIVRERPGLVGLSDDFGIIDEREADAVRDDAVEAWLRTNPDVADRYLSRDLEGNRAEWVKGARWPLLVRDVARAFVQRAKDLQLAPEVLLERLARTREQAIPATQPASLKLARMGIDIYADYQRSLAYRGVVDFSDLIRLALEALRLDPEYLDRLRQRWPFILEDEAQDSSELQEQILRLLAGPEGNWVRVGDPNQAIYDTFTNANPRFLTSFLKEKDVTTATLRESGRSQPAIIELANYLVDWVSTGHPTHGARGAFHRQHIKPTGPGDPQPNPDEAIAAVQLIEREFSPQQELVAVADSLQRWLPSHQNWTVAVLAPRNKRGFELVDLLRQREIPCLELLRSTTTTRHTAGSLGNLLRCLADPTNAKRLAVAFNVWRRDDRDDPEAKELVDAVIRRIRGCQAVEAYLWPRADHDWLAALNSELPDAEMDLLIRFRAAACRWHLAASLPIDQLILTLANELFQEPAELALAHKLAILLRDASRAHPSYRLNELVEELAVIARNERRFLGFDREDTGFEPPAGEVTVTTMHKAKGLEWDRVYLLSLNNYDFPSGLAHDTYIAERWFLRDNLNLEAEALAQLSALAGSPASSPPAPYREKEATYSARLDYVSERLRLLYVGVTRAKKDLILTWNTGRSRDKLQQAVPLIALHDYWEGKNVRYKAGEEP
jgi:DNA helicase-2/ATP-dependent DNA helicase PcrA